jgi:hypothetical protein
MNEPKTTPAPPPEHATSYAGSPVTPPSTTLPPKPLPGPVAGVGAQGSPQTRSAPGLPPPVRGYGAPRVPSAFAHAPPMAHPPSPPGPTFTGGMLASLPQTAAVVTLDPKTRAPVVLTSHSTSPALPRMSSAADPVPRAPAPPRPKLPAAPAAKALPPAPKASPLAGPLMLPSHPLATHPPRSPAEQADVLKAHAARQAAIVAARIAVVAARK